MRVLGLHFFLGRCIWILIAFSLICTLMMSVANQMTQQRIEQNLQEKRLSLLRSVLPAGQFDQRILAQAILVPPPSLLSQDQVLQVYPVKEDGVLQAWVVESEAPNGYGGAIRILVGVDANSLKIIDFRVLFHRETPGVGDYIDDTFVLGQAEPWTQQFSGRSLSEVFLNRRGRSGVGIDARAGATISAQAVISAVHRTLKFAETVLLVARAGGREF